MKPIDKKACKGYLAQAAAPDPNCGLFLLKKLKYVICTEVRIIGHRRILVLYLYSKEKTPQDVPKLAYTMFQASDAFVTYAHGEDVKTRWRPCMLDNLERRDYYFSKDYFAFYSRQDEQRVVTFFKNLKKKNVMDNGLDAIRLVQSGIRASQQHRRELARECAIRDKMKSVRPLPRDVKTWLQREVLPAYFFYDTPRRKEDPVKGVCTACGHEVVFDHAKHNDQGVCPHCGRNVTMKSNGRRGRLWDRVTASVIQRYDQDKLIVRIVKGEFSAWRGEPGEISFYEMTRVIVGMNEKGDPGEEAFHHSSDNWGISPWKKGYPPIMFIYQTNFNAETCGALYCRNLDRELFGTPWQYCQIKAFYESEREEMQVCPYLEVYQKIPAIEFFVKLGLNWLVSHLVYRTGYIGAAQIIHPDGKNLREVLQIDPSDLPILQRPGTTVETLKMLRVFRAADHQPDEGFFDWVKEIGIYDDVLLRRALRYTTPHKLMRYLSQQFEQKKATNKWAHQDVVSDYRDYLGFCEKLNYDLTDDFILFPRNLKQAHDRAQSMIRLDEVKQYDEQIAAAEKQLRQRYQFAKDGLVVLPPHTAREIVSEGQKLHHCVGGYVESAASGSCAILFLRKADDQRTPFFTVEVCDDRVVQVRGANNCSPTEEVKQFLEAWKAKKHLEKAA